MGVPLQSLQSVVFVSLRDQWHSAMRRVSLGRLHDLDVCLTVLRAGNLTTAAQQHERRTAQKKNSADADWHCIPQKLLPSE
jgi:hypothetical protein